MCAQHAHKEVNIFKVPKQQKFSKSLLTPQMVLKAPQIFWGPNSK
jgi:hypothetical protein